jgi:hypothetical protein
MPTTARKTTGKEHYSQAVIKENIKSYANDPFFVKKANEAKEVIKKVGLPILKKK